MRYQLKTITIQGVPFHNNLMIVQKQPLERFVYNVSLNFEKLCEKSTWRSFFRLEACNILKINLLFTT